MISRPISVQSALMIAMRDNRPGQIFEDMDMSNKTRFSILLTAASQEFEEGRQSGNLSWIPAFYDGMNL